jgi:hypothetical protein
MMEAVMRKACRQAESLLDPYAPVKILCERHLERDPHPEGQEAFDLRARFMVSFFGHQPFIFVEHFHKYFVG